MMLAFDASTDWLTVAIGTPDKIMAEINEAAPRAHLNRLLPAIDDLAGESNISLSSLEYIAVGIGPGSYTGSRIAVATAQGLAYALSLPLIGISTLDTIARALVPARGDIYPVLDAKRQEVYTAGYDGQGNRSTDYQVLFPKELAHRLVKSGRQITLAGDGLIDYSDLFSAELRTNLNIAETSLWSPRASVLIELAQEKINECKVKPYFKTLPIYIRLSNAEEALKRGKLS